MYVRIAHFADVTAERVERLVARVEESDGPPPGVPATGIQLRFDESQGTAIAVQLFDSAEDMRRETRRSARWTRPRRRGGACPLTSASSSWIVGCKADRGLASRPA
jgi:hypothetical protein